MPGVSAGFKTVNVLCVYRDGEVVTERVKIHIGWRNRDSYPAFVRYELCSIRDHMAAIAHSLFERL
jgi:hypothetical protein